MGDTTLQDLLIEYNKKKIQAERDADLKAQQIYEKYPELADLNSTINSIGFNIIKSILNANTAESDALNHQLEELKSKKTDLLKLLHLSVSDFEPIYECSICQDTGYITSDNKSTMCSCLKQKLINSLYNKSNIYNLDKENFDTFNINYYSATVDKNKYKSDISPRENILKIKKIVDNFIENFDNLDEKNLLFTGNPGLGKTFFSNCIAKEILNRGKTVIYQTAPMMLDNIIDYKFGKNNISSNYYNDLLNCDLLIIDDLGTESINNLKFTELFNLLNTRLLNQLNKPIKTIISTNLDIQDLFNYYDEKIVSRLIGNYNICKFFGDDIRFKKIKK